MLGVTLQINEKILAFYEIRRVKPVDRHPTDNTICLYNVYDDEGNILLKEIKHRYGDMAESLTAKVMRKIKHLRKAVVL